MAEHGVAFELSDARAQGFLSLELHAAPPGDVNAGALGRHILLLHSLVRTKVVFTLPRLITVLDSEQLLGNELKTL